MSLISPEVEVEINPDSSSFAPPAIGATGAAARAHSEPVRAYAAIWRRFAASWIDVGLITAGFVPAVLIIIWGMEALHSDLRMSVRHARYLSGILTVAAWVIGDWIYNAKLLSSERGATVGKRAVGIRVVGLLGERVSFAQASTRHFTKFLSTFLLFFGFIMATFTRRSQALHDVVAGTLVVEDPRR